MNTTEIILFVVAFLALLVLLITRLLKPPAIRKTIVPLPGHYRELLSTRVKFYQGLDDGHKDQFEEKVQEFLSSIRITGVGVAVEDIDRVLVGASAVIPIYAFPGWHYINLHEVLLYPETFDEEFETGGHHRDVLGMVGSGAMQHVMILSRPALREGFANKTDKSNTAIHEFVHLVDKIDGEADGIPGVLLEHQYTLPWLNMMHKEIKEIAQQHSDINPYGSTNQAEFFAVASEYFFERPDLLQSKHPELYQMLSRIFNK